MAIYNLSGNFQPPSVDSGRSLPQSNGRAPSTSNAENQTVAVDKGLTVVAGNEVSKLNTQLTDAVAEKTVDSNKAIKSPIEEIQTFNQSINRSLQFEVDDDLGVTIVRVVDKDTDELIRQFPPEELINLSRRLKELNEEDSGNSGILLQEKV